MFKEEVIIDEKNRIIKIVVSTEMRKFAIEKKVRYHLDPFRLIPDQFKVCAKLIEKPLNEISNINYKDHAPSGTWIYKLVDRNKTNPTKTTQTKRRTRRSTKKQTTQKRNNE